MALTHPTTAPGGVLALSGAQPLLPHSLQAGVASAAQAVEEAPLAGALPRRRPGRRTGGRDGSALLSANRQEWQE